MLNNKNKIIYAKKILEALKEIDILDKKLTRKYNKNQHELEFYDSLLNESNNNFNNIIKNIKI